MSPDAIRVVVCGDDAVGKSSLITSLIKETIIEPQTNNVLPPITISRNDYIESSQEYLNDQDHHHHHQLSPSTMKNKRKHNNKRERERERERESSINNVQPNEILEYIPNITTIIDTSSSDMTNLQKELKRADVIWLVYSDHYTYERISLHWMLLFRSMGVNLPIILCANKSDLFPKSKSNLKSTNSDEFVPLINEFKEIEAGVRCSAKNNYNVVEAFYLCQRAVTHPISPIFDAKEGNLKPGAIKPLKRIFWLSDTDQDGYLNFEELSELHKKCFGIEASKSDYEEIVNLIDQKILPSYNTTIETQTPPQQQHLATSAGTPNGTTTTTSKGISEDGFILLNKIYAESGRHETVWCILRAYHYTNSLSLSDKFLYPRLDVNPHSSVELSPTGYKFFVDLFIKFDKDNDGGLNEDELNTLFRSTPGIPKLWVESNFPSSIVCNEEGYVTLQGWLAQWNLTTFLSYKTTLEYLAYLGFDEGNSTKALKVTKPRKIRQKNGKTYRNAVNDRNVFNCFIVGAPKAGKSSLLELFLHGSYSDIYSPTIQPRLVVKDIELRGGKQCYLILEELGELEPAILENKSRLDQCDVICYAYDSSDPESFQYLVELREKHGHLLDEVPAVFVALKADLDKQQQRCDVQPENYTCDLFLNSPLHVSLAWNTSLHEMFIQLVDAAKTPSSATPGIELEVSVDQDDIKHIIMTGAAIAVVGLVSIWVLNSLRR